MPNTIPLYSDTGKYIRHALEADILDLLAKRRVTVDRNRRNRIVRAIRSGQYKSAVSKTAHMGQRYSFLENLEDGHRCWKHRQIASPDSEADFFIRRIFRSSVLDIMVPA